MGCLLSEVAPVQAFYSFHSGKMDAATNIQIQLQKNQVNCKAKCMSSLQLTNIILHIWVTLLGHIQGVWEKDVEENTWT